VLPVRKSERTLTRSDRLARETGRVEKHRAFLKGLGSCYTDPGDVTGMLARLVLTSP
jgi:hypothetical protein